MLNDESPVMLFRMQNRHRQGVLGRGTYVRTVFPQPAFCQQKSVQDAVSVELSFNTGSHTDSIAPKITMTSFLKPVGKLWLVQNPLVSSLASQGLRSSKATRVVIIWNLSKQPNFSTFWECRISLSEVLHSLDITNTFFFLDFPNLSGVPLISRKYLV